VSTPIFPNYIDGAWVEGPTFENRNPANTAEIVGLHVAGTPADIARAAAAAEAALPAWSAMNGPARGALLFKVAELLDARFDDIAADMTREEGKTLPEAKGEVRRSINIFRYFAGEGSRLAGTMAPSERPRVHMFAIRKPVGVVASLPPGTSPAPSPPGNSRPPSSAAIPSS
jgi:alpha-ketoglutaric semialdehyde dehydrogenase